MLPFSGPALPLAPGDIDRAAAELGCEPEAVHAVLTVETGGAGGFLSDGSQRPRVLFEAKIFGDHTGHQYDVSHPAISSSFGNWKLYRGGAAEYDRLGEALALNRPAALASASWGLFQVMGFNWRSLGYASLEAFVAAMAQSEGEHLEAFVLYCKRNYLADALEDRNWARFARGYNGPGYAANHYDTKLADAYELAHGRSDHDEMPRLGSRSDQVARIQDRLKALGFNCGTTDGIFGRATDFALRRFQAAMGLQVDGIAGPATLGKLRP